MTDISKLTIQNFAGGAADELFQRELRAVIDNIDDANTEATSVRSVTLTFNMKPDAQKQTMQLSLQAKSKLTPVMGAGGIGYLGRHNGKLKAYNHDVNQLELDTEQKLQLAENGDQE